MTKPLVVFPSYSRPASHVSLRDLAHRCTHPLKKKRDLERNMKHRKGEAENVLAKQSE